MFNVARLLGAVFAAILMMQGGTTSAQTPPPLLRGALPYAIKAPE